MAGRRRLPTMTERISEISLEMFAKAVPSTIMNCESVHHMFSTGWASAPHYQYLPKRWGATEVLCVR